VAVEFLKTQLVGAVCVLIGCAVWFAIDGGWGLAAGVATAVILCAIYQYAEKQEKLEKLVREKRATAIVAQEMEQYRRNPPS